MLNTSIVDKRTTNVDSRSFSYGANSLQHTSDGTFFVSFKWDSDVAKRLMGDSPRYKENEGKALGERPVEIVSLVTMLDHVVAELRYR